MDTRALPFFEWVGALLYFIDYKLVKIFSMKSVYTRSFEHLNKVSVRAPMDYKLEEQKSIITFLLLEDENLATFFKGCRKVFLKPAYPSNGNCCPTFLTAKTLPHASFICFRN